MLKTKDALKHLLLKVGIFGIVRDVYRIISPWHRREIYFNRRFYREIVKKGDLCFDIGANVGQTTEVLLEIGAIVVSVEPNPLCHQVLKKFEINRNLSLVRKAVGSANGFAELNINGTDTTASLRKDWPYLNAKETIRVQVITLDDLILEFGRPKFLKVDVEGFELEVFKGLSQPIELIYFEMHGKEVELAVEIIERIKAIGEVVGMKVATGDNSDWLLNYWIPASEVFDRLGKQLPRQANIIIKMKTDPI